MNEEAKEKAAWIDLCLLLTEDIYFCDCDLLLTSEFSFPEFPTSSQ